MTTQISKLRQLNLLAALLHTISFLGIVLLSNDVTLPVTATYPTDPPTSWRSAASSWSTSAWSCSAGCRRATAADNSHSAPTFGQATRSLRPRAG
jgi:hypothetical protein